LLALLVVCGVGAAGTWVIQRRIETDPAIVFLASEGEAQWIQLNRPFELRSHKDGGDTVEFRTPLAVDAIPVDPVLTVRALKQAAVFLDGEPIPVEERTPEEWKRAIEIDFTSRLQPGRHELRIIVTNESGPALLLAYSPSGVFPSTSGAWEARRPAGDWRPALPVDRPMAPPEIVRRYPSSRQALRQHAPLLAVIFAGVFMATVLPSWRSRLHRVSEHFLHRRSAPADLRWGLFGLWGVLALNSLWKVPRLGFDADAHLDYITYMTQHLVPPLATDGWQMFQTPLYYMLAAAWVRILTLFVDIDVTERLLRVIPLLCGLGQIEICYRVMKLTFPRRENVQCLGILLGGLLPMNLYMSQHLGNEPLAGVLSALVVLASVRFLNEATYATAPRTPWIVGMLLSLAILTKVTAVLLVPPVVVCLAVARFRETHRPSQVVIAVVQCTLVIGLLTGWYFARNWVELGRPYIGGWDASRGIFWWQDPGFRTRAQFLTFGRSLMEPVYAARFGFWDAVYSSLWLDGFASGIAEYDYRPPWNDSLMVLAPWLAILPTIAILLGLPAICLPSQRPVRLTLLFAAACLAIYFAAMLALFFKLPIYSTAKATYTLGLIPCYALLGAAGFGAMLHNRVLRAFVYAWMTCWALFSYLAYLAW
jgi:hypothetical protein